MLIEQEFCKKKICSTPEETVAVVVEVEVSPEVIASVAVEEAVSAAEDTVSAAAETVAVAVLPSVEAVLGFVES